MGQACHQSRQAGWAPVCACAEALSMPGAYLSRSLASDQVGRYHETQTLH